MLDQFNRPSRRYVIVALVPEPLRLTMADLRRRHDLFTRQWLPPHVTVVPPFDEPLTRDEQQAITVKVEVALSGWGLFRRDRTSVIYQQLPVKSFDAVRAEVVRLAPRLATFTPSDSEYHVTVVSRIPNEQFDEVWKTVTAQPVTGSFTIDRLTLYEWDFELRRWIEVL
jgi:hypothetical protein